MGGRAIPLRFAVFLGVKRFVMATEMHGFGEGMRAGDLLSVNDHLNVSGVSPLQGPNVNEFGERFFDIGEAYNKEIRAVLEGGIKDVKVH